MTYTGKNVLVTGASKGLGAQIAKYLAARGLKVWINYRSKPELADTLREDIMKNGGEAACISFDASDEAAVVAAFALIKDADNELSYLVNNAGITRDKLALRMSEADFMDVINANLKSMFLCSREALKLMSKQRFGAVVSISSIIGLMGNAGQANYAASKAGMIALSKSLAKEAGSRGVRFNSVAPGFIESDMTAVLSEDIRKNYQAAIPLARFGAAADVAAAVGFLLSDEASYITGECLSVNGGMYM